MYSGLNLSELAREVLNVKQLLSMGLIVAMTAFASAQQESAPKQDSIAQLHRDLIDYQEKLIKEAVLLEADMRQVPDEFAKPYLTLSANSFGGKSSLSIYKLSSLATSNSGGRYFGMSLLIEHLQESQSSIQQQITFLSVLKQLEMDSRTVVEINELRRSLRSHADKLKHFTERALKFSQRDKNEEDYHNYSLHVYGVKLLNPNDRPMSFNSWKEAQKEKSK